MRTLTWSPRKDEWLRKHRQISFDEIAGAILGSGYIGTRENLSSRHTGQSLFIVRIRGYVWAVPFRETSSEINLITAYPSRKLNHVYQDPTKPDEAFEARGKD